LWQVELNEDFTLAVGHQLSDHETTASNQCSSNASHPSSETFRARSIICHGQFECRAT
jgi:hypothetical protein